AQRRRSDPRFMKRAAVVTLPDYRATALTPNVVVSAPWRSLFGSSELRDEALREQISIARPAGRHVRAVLDDHRGRIVLARAAPTEDARAADEIVGRRERGAHLVFDVRVVGSIVAADLPRREHVRRPLH